MSNENNTPTTNGIRAACIAAAGRVLANLTEERKSVCVIRALRVFETADRFPVSLFISTEDKAGFVVWSTIGTPFKTTAVQQFIDGIVAEARKAHEEIQKAREAAANDRDPVAA